MTPRLLGWANGGAGRYKEKPRASGRGLSRRPEKVSRVRFSLVGDSLRFASFERAKGGFPHGERLLHRTKSLAMLNLMNLDELESLFAYDTWANDLILDAAKGLPEEAVQRDLGASHQSLLGTLVHIVAAEEISALALEGSSARETHRTRRDFELRSAAGVLGQGQEGAGFLRRLTRRSRFSSGSWK